VIIEEASNLLVLADRRHELQQLVAEAKKYLTRRQQIESARARLQRAVETAALFRTKSVGLVEPPANVASVSKLAVDTAVEFAASPSATLDSLGDVEKRVGVLVDRIDLVLQELWRNYARANARSDNNELLDVLEKIPDFRAAMLKIRALLSQLQLHTSNVPAAAFALDAFHATLAAISAEWSALGSDAVPATVVEFLRKAVSTDGAHLDAVVSDPAIFTWLNDKKLMQAFRIKLA
jgi:hypothetical protein